MTTSSIACARGNCRTAMWILVIRFQWPATSPCGLTGQARCITLMPAVKRLSKSENRSTLYPRSADLIGRILSETKEGSRQFLVLETEGFVASLSRKSVIWSEAKNLHEFASIRNRRSFASLRIVTCQRVPTGCLNSVHGKECYGCCAMRRRIRSVLLHELYGIAAAVPGRPL